MAGGIIKKFTDRPGEEFELGGDTYKVSTTGKNYSLKRLSDKQLRFEVRYGDTVVDSDVRNDRDRSEIAMRRNINKSKTAVVSYDMLVEPGPLSTPDWCCIGQWHATDPGSPDVPEGRGRPPPAALMFGRGDTLGFEIRYGAFGEITTLVPWRGHKIKRDRWYHVEIKTRFLRNAKGFCRVWLDGKRYVNYDGPTGFDDSNYWKVGIYRAHAKEVLAVRIRDMDFTLKY